MKNKGESIPVQPVDKDFFTILCHILLIFSPFVKTCMRRKTPKLFESTLIRYKMAAVSKSDPDAHFSHFSLNNSQSIRAMKMKLGILYMCDYTCRIRMIFNDFNNKWPK